MVGADDGRLVAYDLQPTAAPVSHVDAHDGAVRSLQFVDAAARIAASPARAATPPRQATPPRGHAARQATPRRRRRGRPSPRRVAPPPLPAVEPEAPPPPPSPARLYREKQKSPDKAPGSPVPGRPACVLRGLRRRSTSPSVDSNLHVHAAPVPDPASPRWRRCRGARPRIAALEGERGAAAGERAAAALVVWGTSAPLPVTPPWLRRLAGPERGAHFSIELYESGGCVPRAVKRDPCA